jgi:hypothetical protein
LLLAAAACTIYAGECEVKQVMLLQALNVLPVAALLLLAWLQVCNPAPSIRLAQLA